MHGPLASIGLYHTWANFTSRQNSVDLHQDKNSGLLLKRIVSSPKDYNSKTENRLTIATYMEREKILKACKRTKAALIKELMELKELHPQSV